MVQILTFLSKLKIQFVNKFKQSLVHNKNKTDETKQHEKIHLDINEFFNKYVGKLLVRSELNITDDELKRLIDKQIVRKFTAIKKKMFTYECQRCGNQDQSLFAKMPCLQCDQQSIYCRKCVVINRVMICDYLYYIPSNDFTWPTLKRPCTWQGKLNESQLKAANKLLINKKKLTHTLVWSVTGSGKTEMIFPVITKALQSGKRVCIATPRKDVVRELLPRCEQAFKHVQIDALYGGSKSAGTAQFIIATTHQLIRYKRAFDLLIIDEIDAFPYHHDPSLPYVTERALKNKGMMIDLTATPRREQKWKMNLNQLDYIFVPSRYHGYPLPVPTLHYSYHLTRYLTKNKLPPTFMKWLKKRKKPQRQLLIFVPTIELASKLKTHLIEILKQYSIIKNDQLITSVHANDRKREEKINLFREQKINILITTTILERGVTFPSIDVVVIQACHDVFDEAALIQIAGRAGRSKHDPTGEVLFIHEGKTDALINARESIIQMNERAQKERGEIK